jgi:hypothetical protein
MNKNINMNKYKINMNKYEENKNKFRWNSNYGNRFSKHLQ